MPSKLRLPRRQKYGNRSTVVDGIRFQSTKEARRYGELRLLEKAGEIRNLHRQIPFDLWVKGIRICRYVADFTYDEKAPDGWSRQDVVEDCKGFRTREYKIKKALMLACHGIEIKET